MVARSDQRLQKGATQGASVMSVPAPTDVVLIVCGEPADQAPEHLARIQNAAAGAKVALVAPALPLPGERWIADRAARAGQARGRLQRWSAVLARHAVAIAAEIGDADPRLAAADARRELPAAQVIDAPAAVPRMTAAPGRLAQLVDRYGRAPVPLVTGR
jgi:hypothetical protein